MAAVVDGYVDLGAGTSLITGADINGSTLLGGASNDTFNLTESGATSTINLNGGGASLISASGQHLRTSIVGGAGNDSVDHRFEFHYRSADTSAVDNTNLIGSGGGNDTIAFW